MYFLTQVLKNNSLLSPAIFGGKNHQKNYDFFYRKHKKSQDRQNNKIILKDII